MKIDAAIFDLDGTLLNDEKEISLENRKTIKELQQAGVKIILATGRNDVYVKGISEDLGQIDAIISCNGASIRRLCTDELIYSCYLNKEIVTEIAEGCFTKQFDFTASVYGAMYCVENSQRVKIFHEYNEKMPERCKISIKVIHSANDLREQNVLKMFIWQLNAREKDDFLKACDLKDISVVSSENGGLDIGHVETSKGKAVDIFAEKYNISMDRIAVFGDYDNDISMFERAGYSFAMGNASEKVKSYAKYITKSNNEDGVAWGIKKYLK